jgi:hypothetical protein
MSEVDYVIPEIVIEKEGFIDLQELYSLLKEYLVKRRYDLIEKEHHFKESSSNLEIKWDSFKKVDDYTKFHIEIAIKGSNIKETTSKKHKGVSGTFKIKFESYLEKDYEEIFENRPISKFFRTVYDKFIIKTRFDAYNAELKEETYLVYNEAKAFLNIKKFE